MTYKDFIQNILNTRGRFNCGEKYHERHHIVPKCMNGNNDEDNLIDLYAREHFIAHKLLAEENPYNKGLQYAWWNMTHCGGRKEQDRYSCTKEEYESARTAYSKSITGKNNPNYGNTMSDSSKKSISEAQHNRKRSLEEQKKRLSTTRRGENHPNYGGKFVTDEWRKKQSESHKGKTLSEETKYKMSLKRRKGDNANAKKVVAEGVVYDCLADCSEHYNVKMNGWLSRKDSHIPKKWLFLNLHFLKEEN